MAVPVQLPPAQASPVVQASPSSHELVLLAWTQPEAWLHESSVQSLLSLQLRLPDPGWQLPPTHVSPVVHASSSLQPFVSSLV
jgi:hypothetical protein